MDGRSIGLHCILVDDRQDAIEACSTEMDHEVLASKVQARNCYEITNFRINRRANTEWCQMTAKLCSCTKQFSRELQMSFHAFFATDFSYKTTICFILGWIVLIY